MTEEIKNQISQLEDQEKQKILGFLLDESERIPCLQLELIQRDYFKLSLSDPASLFPGSSSSSSSLPSKASSSLDEEEFSRPKAAKEPSSQNGDLARSLRSIRKGFDDSEEIRELQQRFQKQVSSFLILLIYGGGRKGKTRSLRTNPSLLKTLGKINQSINQSIKLFFLRNTHGLERSSPT